MAAFYRDARLALGDIPPAFLKPAEKASLEEARRVHPPVIEALDRFVLGKPSGISAVICADGKRRTVEQMVKEAEEAGEKTK